MVFLSSTMWRREGGVGGAKFFLHLHNFIIQSFTYQWFTKALGNAGECKGNTVTRRIKLLPARFTTSFPSLFFRVDGSSALPYDLGMLRF